MFDNFNSESFWLNVTNAVLGLVTLVCVAIVGRVTFKEIYERLASRKRIPLAQDSHAFDLADLGITMADGGVRIDEVKQNPQTVPNVLPDPENIIRSNN